MMLERLLADVDAELAASSTRALAGRELGGRRTRRGCCGAQGADLYALLQAADVARARRQGRRRLLRHLPQHQLHQRLLRRLHVLRLLAPQGRRGRLRPPDGGDFAKARDAVARGATELCIQGGIHPNKDHTHYREILVCAEARVSAAPHPRVLARGDRLRAQEERACRSRSTCAGWWTRASGTMPGTAAEILDDSIRQIVSPRKLQRDRWIEIVRGGARDRAALDLDADVRAHRAGAPRRAPPRAAARHPEADGRLHRVRAARLHPREERAVQPHARAARLVDAGGSARGRGRAPLPAPVDHERPGVVGEDGSEARADRRSRRARTTSAGR